MSYTSEDVNVAIIAGDFNTLVKIKDSGFRVGDYRRDGHVLPEPKVLVPEVLRAMRGMKFTCDDIKCGGTYGTGWRMTGLLQFAVEDFPVFDELRLWGLTLSDIGSIRMRGLTVERLEKMIQWGVNYSFLRSEFALREAIGDGNLEVPCTPPS